MAKKNWHGIRLFVMLSVCAIIFGHAHPLHSAEEKTFAQHAAGEIIFAHGANPGNPRYIAAEKWRDLYLECQKDFAPQRVLVVPSAAMGDDLEMLAAVRSGIIQISANSQGTLAQIVPELGLIGLPFLFSDQNTAWRVMDGTIGDALDALAIGKGIKILGFWDNGIRHISHVSKNVPQPADLQGMRIRVPPDQMATDIFQMLGAQPRAWPFSKLGNALQRGTFEGQENPLSNIYASHLHEMTPYITLTGHKYEVTPIIASVWWWRSLPADVQNCAQKATRAAGIFQRTMLQNMEKKLQGIMISEGVVFKTADRAAYIAATRPIYTAYAKKFPMFIKQLLDAVAAETPAP